MHNTHTQTIKKQMDKYLGLSCYVIIIIPIWISSKQFILKRLMMFSENVVYVCVFFWLSHQIWSQYILVLQRQLIRE